MKNGPYELVKAPLDYPGKKYRGLYCYEHHLVYWKKHRIVPSNGEVIHHKNGIKRDNRIQNLELKTVKEHNADHNKKPPWIGNCDNCFKSIQRMPGNIEYKKRMGQKYFFCSIKCQALKQHSLGGRLRD